MAQPIHPHRMFLGALLLLAPLALSAAPLPCVGGQAGAYPCSEIDLLAHMPMNTIGGGEGNDLWGWTDPLTGKEYALMGRTSGTAFIDISEPTSPVYLGDLPTHTVDNLWRDIKVYADHAFIVSEQRDHGMQIFDLTQLRDVVSPPVTFTSTAHYDGVGGTHNIAIDEETGFAYLVGSNTCSGGLHMVDIRAPTSPVFAGCFTEDGHTHDAQCVVYRGPDSRYLDREICFGANNDALTIVDVTDKSDPTQISSTPYTGSSFTHQGWLTEDQAHFLLGDEFDEIDFGHNTRTWIWDLQDLENPLLSGTFDGPTTATDHNIYVRGRRAYLAAYTAGLRILDLEQIAGGTLSEMAYFDLYPPEDDTGFRGAWSVYPFFASGVLIVSAIEDGLFILLPREVFSDSFESGDPLFWSSIVP